MKRNRNGKQMKINCGAERHHYSMLIVRLWKIRRWTFDVGPARNAFKLVRGKFNNLIHNSMIALTQRTMHGRRAFIFKTTPDGINATCTDKNNF